MGLCKAVAVVAAGLSASLTLVSAAACPDDPQRFELDDPPYTNYFISDCHSASQVVVTSPLPDSDLSVISPRLLVSGDGIWEMK